jgi:signal transduction histidine kinase
VTDRGPGISDENRRLIFDPFFTTKSKMPSAGLGLGLSIANSMAVAMGGKIEFDTQPGHGTTFNITLPRQHRPVLQQNGGSAHGGAK